MIQQHDAHDLIELFNALFLLDFNTRLQGGADEPLYEPATAFRPALIHFREDFFASALHEVAHWCIAGRRRRQMLDYGYWYAPDGRNAAQQRVFESVEAAPQALEWIFADAARFPFRPSLDNLDADADSGARFRAAIRAQRARRCKQGLPARAARFQRALAECYGASAQPTGYRVHSS